MGFRYDVTTTNRPTIIRNVQANDFCLFKIIIKNYNSIVLNKTNIVSKTIFLYKSIINVVDIYIYTHLFITSLE